MYYLLTPVTTPPKKEGWYPFTNAAMNIYTKNRWISEHWKILTPTRFTHYLAPVEEGQKATVEAKSAGVWVKASERLPKERGLHYVRTLHKDDKPKADNIVRSLRIFDPETNQWEVSPFEPGEASYIVTEYLDETPTSHAEGEKGAVGFAEWIAEEKWEWYPEAELWCKWYDEGETVMTFERNTTLELHNLYLTC